MAFCANCGSPVEGKFCVKCGAPVGAAGSVETPPPASPAAAGTGLQENVASALCYLLGFITGIIFLVLAPYNQNKTIRFHAFQSILVSVGLLVINFASSIVLPLSLSLPLSGLIGLAGFLLWLFLMYKAYNGEKVVLPVVGPMAEKQA